jgi:hypothetical protein
MLRHPGHVCTVAGHKYFEQSTLPLLFFNAHQRSYDRIENSTQKQCRIYVLTMPCNGNRRQLAHHDKMT